MSEGESSGAEAAEEEGGSSSPDEEAIDEEAMEEDEFIKEILVRNTEHIDRDPNYYEPEESDGPADDEPEVKFYSELKMSKQLTNFCSNLILKPNKPNEKSKEGNDGEDGDDADDEDEDESPEDSAKS